MIHLNNNILCVIDAKTSGKRPCYHDIIELCIMPVGADFLPDHTILPFHMHIQPKRPENIEWINSDSCNMEKNKKFAIDPWTVQELFEQWYEKLDLLEFKRIQPLAYDWPKQRMFIQDWFGYSEKEIPFFYDFFDPFRFRDLVSTAIYFNDLAYYNVEPYPIQKNNFAYVCNRLNVIQRIPKDCLSRCFAILECWKKLAAMKMRSGFDLDLHQPAIVDYSPYQAKTEETEEEESEEN